MTGFRFTQRGSAEDKSLRTAGMRAKTDPKLIADQLPLIPRAIRAFERRVRRK